MNEAQPKQNSVLSSAKQRTLSLNVIAVVCVVSNQYKEIVLIAH